MEAASTPADRPYRGFRRRRQRTLRQVRAISPAGAAVEK